VNDKQTAELVKVFERHYKYYKGWVFEYEHPGYFVYHQMGGPLSVAFTPDHDAENEVSLQVHDDSGGVISSQSVPYTPSRHDVLPTRIDPFVLFTIVRPLLENHGSW